MNTVVCNESILSKYLSFKNIYLNLMYVIHYENKSFDKKNFNVDIIITF